MNSNFSPFIPLPLLDIPNYKNTILVPRCFTFVYYCDTYSDGFLIPHWLFLPYHKSKFIYMGVLN